ncbi:MAG: hypothetical protein ACOY3J_04995 [Bacillota bacterium]|jgi:membrane peptidoglycan carboxypeptidase|uniref:Uncharacterized protein n=1 Tax=Thermanaerosceptrum fracticalcis TaxID=1712410 RepID=A0A7G6DYH5_THEFR|nr:hypothetical protein [Thermanaerosceptrum fracticalcis]QNB44879.1 hypothetical protein BR63_00155 [Thermanaerosceptrum fracticalcis]
MGRKIVITSEYFGRFSPAGYKIYTTLDTKVQKKMEEVYTNPLHFPKGENNEIIQSAMVVIDHRTG